MKKKNQLYIIFLFVSLTALTQNKIEWSEDYNLSKSDYLAQAPNSGSMQTVSGSFYVEYEIGGLSLITTRNLNENVKCYFQKDASYIDDGDDTSTQRLIRYQQLIFDLYELQARNLRKKFFEERKRLLTKGPAILWEEVSAENAKLVAEMERETNHGSELKKIIEWEQAVKSEFENLAIYCKTCNPKKNKRK